MVRHKQIYIFCNVNTAETTQLSRKYNETISDIKKAYY